MTFLKKNIRLVSFDLFNIYGVERHQIVNLYSLQLRKMATKETVTKSSMHLRRNSLPIAPHPLVPQFENHLNRLKDSQAPSSLSSSSISQKLNRLQDLHECTDKLLQLPVIQQSLAQDCSDKWIDELD